MYKKLIFVGGTARSGSTLLDLILANDPKAMSLGEIHALFRPTRKHHFEELKSLKEDPVWSEILKGGKKNLFPNLIKYFPDVDIFVDSSKDPFWFRFHEKNNKDKYQIKHVLIYKSPEELAKSFIKRGKNSAWINTYLHYHKTYFGLINNFRTIYYKELIVSEEELKSLCIDIGINYFNDKKNYWEKTQNSFFGSNTVKSSTSLKASKQLKENGRSDLTYDNPFTDMEFVDEQIKNNKKIYKIFNVLKARYSSRMSFKGLKYNHLTLFILNQKAILKRTYRFFKPENYFNK